MTQADKILIYGDECCPYCGAARMLLKKKGLAFDDILVSRSNKRQKEMREKSGSTSVPQIFIGDTYVGGFEDLVKLDESGRLDELLAARR